MTLRPEYGPVLYCGRVGQKFHRQNDHTVRNAIWFAAGVGLGLGVGVRYSASTTPPVDVVAKWAATTLGGPIKIGEVVIRTGDYALADRDGIVIIPGEIVEEVVTETEKVLQKENVIRKAILQGVDPVQAYLTHGKF
jgi:regulator of RNase E activity RraA